MDAADLEARVWCGVVRCGVARARVCVCLCVNRGEEAGLVAAANQLSQGAELYWSPSPPSELNAEAIHDFGDVILSVGEERRGCSRTSSA